jgi:uncharacterized protein YidB (DUF937 family)
MFSDAAARKRQSVIDFCTAFHTVRAMGLFDILAKQALGSLAGGSGNPQGDLLSSLLNQAGGLTGLMERFNQAGLNEAFASWVGPGVNLAVQPDQLHQALGSDAINGLAGRIGLEVKTVLPLLSQFLPQVIDKLTPNGIVDDPNPSADQLQKVMASVMKGGLGSLFGGNRA